MSQSELGWEYRPYIDAEWVDGGNPIVISDLAVGGTFAEVAAATPEMADNALRAADRATDSLRDTTAMQRSRWCEAIAEALDTRSEELAEVIVREAGKPITSSRSEVKAAITRFRRAAEEARSVRGEYITGSTEGHEGWEGIVKPEPMGTVLCITPYNYPLSTTALHVAPALAAGNSVVLKPASETPISGAILAEVIADLDLPPGAFNFVPGRGSEIGDVLVGDDRVNCIAMTGSSAAGDRVARESGMAKLHLELGGNAPAIVFPDVDLADVASACASGSLSYAGQRCSAVSRVLVHAEIHDELATKIDDLLSDWETGDLFEEDTDFGPVISEAQAERIDALVDGAVSDGSELVRGGAYAEPVDGVFVYEPTLVVDIPHRSDLLQEEQFGPVVAVSKFQDEREAIRIANASDLALDAAVFTAEYDRALRVADSVEAGAVRINGPPSHGIGDIPFGGNKASGIGREGIDTSIHTMMRTKSIVL